MLLSFSNLCVFLESVFVGYRSRVPAGLKTLVCDYAVRFQLCFSLFVLLSVKACLEGSVRN